MKCVEHLIIFMDWEISCDKPLFRYICVCLWWMVWSASERGGMVSIYWGRWQWHGSSFLNHECIQLKPKNIMNALSYVREFLTYWTCIGFPDISSDTKNQWTHRLVCVLIQTGNGRRHVTLFNEITGPWLDLLLYLFFFQGE